MLLFHSPRRLALLTVLFFLAGNPVASDLAFGQSQAEEVPSATEIRVLSQKNCVSCHMPQYTIPEMHTTFTNHKIAIHRPGAPFTE